LLRVYRGTGQLKPGSGGHRPSERERYVSSKLFVGGLSWDTTDDSLKSAFESFGEISEAKVILDRNSGRSRGFGFVTFESEENARKAMDAMKDTELDGRTIRVDLANDRR
jgi:cold-inducible RNA-binding protein